MQKRSGQTMPQIPPSGFWLMIIAAARRQSLGSPMVTARMKSAGEQ